MTKLTQQEIEKERELFEQERIKVIFGKISINRYLDRCNSTGEYLESLTQERWLGWLARAEMDKGE